MTESPRTATVDPPEDDSPRLPQLVQDKQAPVVRDLQRLAKRFVRYAVGVSDRFPHRDSVSMSLGGQSFGPIHVKAGLSHRAIWRGCPGDWDTYGGSLCPVDFLGPIHEAVVIDEVLVYSAEFGEVICAPLRTSEPPTGRLVVLRPPRNGRTCSHDFALVLVADEQGLLRSVDLTLSNP